MKVFDTFPILNELDLLEMRLKIMWDEVDYFVITEANTTYTNVPKSYNLLDNWERFKPYHEKIIRVQVSDMPGSNDAWTNEKHQADSIVRGLGMANPEDIIIVSQLDEIVRPSVIRHMKSSSSDRWALRMPVYFFRLNYVRYQTHHWEVWNIATRKKHLGSARDLLGLRRNFDYIPNGGSHSCAELIEHAGWHFSYLGDLDQIRRKLSSFSHREFSHFIGMNLDILDIMKRGESFPGWPQRYQTVKIDDYYPKEIRENADLYSNWINQDDAIYGCASVLPPASQIFMD